MRLNGLNKFRIGNSGAGQGNATPADLLAGKTASTDAGDISGTMQNNGPASVETVNLTSQNQEYSIAAGFHSGLRKVKAVISGLAAGVIKAGTTVGGVAGTFTSDANAAAGDILSGKTAYVNGNKVTGNIPTRATIIAPKAFNQVWNGSAFDLIATPEPGYYTGSYPSTLIMSDPDFRQENIKEGVDIFGVVGTMAQGKKWASGTVTSVLSAGSTYKHIVRGLSFSPTRGYMWRIPTGIFIIVFEKGSNMFNAMYGASDGLRFKHITGDEGSPYYGGINITYYSDGIELSVNEGASASFNYVLFE